jgi:signal recognition particle subunit SRP54
MNASRKRRVASGSGVEVQEVNKLLKMHRQMADMMKKIGRQKGGLGAFLGMGGGAGLPQPDPAMLEQIQKSGLGGLPGGLPGGMGGGIGGLPPFPGGMPRLPGMGGRLPGLPGLGKKK